MGNRPTVAQKLQRTRYLFRLVFLSCLILCVLGASPCLGAATKNDPDPQSLPAAASGTYSLLSWIWGSAAPAPAPLPTPVAPSPKCPLTYPFEAYAIINRIELLRQLGLNPEDIEKILPNMLVQNFLGDLEAVTNPQATQKTNRSITSEELLTDGVIYIAYRRLVSHLVHEFFYGLVLAMYDKANKHYTPYIKAWLTQVEKSPTDSKESEIIHKHLMGLATNMSDSQTTLGQLTGAQINWGKLKKKYAVPLPRQNPVIRGLGYREMPTLFPGLWPEDSSARQTKGPVQESQNGPITVSHPLSLKQRVERTCIQIATELTRNPVKAILAPVGLVTRTVIGPIVRNVLYPVVRRIVIYPLRRFVIAPLVRLVVDFKAVKEACDETIESLKVSPTGTVLAILDFMKEEDKPIEILLNTQVAGVTDDIANIVLPMLEQLINYSVPAIGWLYCAGVTCTPPSIMTKIVLKFLSCLQKLAIAQMSFASVRNITYNYMDNEGNWKLYVANRIAWFVDGAAIPIALSGIFYDNPNDFKVVWWTNSISFGISFVSMGLRLWSIRNNIKDKIIPSYNRHIAKKAGPYAAWYHAKMASAKELIEMGLLGAIQKSALEALGNLKDSTLSIADPTPLVSGLSQWASSFFTAAPTQRKTVWQGVYDRLPSRNTMMVAGLGIVNAAIVGSFMYNYFASGEPTTTPAT